MSEVFAPRVEEIAYRDPVAAFSPWAEAGDGPAALLHGGQDAGGRGRFSYLAVEPFRMITAKDGVASVDGRPVEGSPLTALERELAGFRLPPGCAPVPFVTGAVGFLGYELGRTLERLPGRHAEDLGIPDLAIGLYDVVIAFDHQRRQGWIVSSGFPEHGAPARRDRARARADAIAARLDAAPSRLAPPPPAESLAWRAEIPRATYLERVARALEYIRAGDIFQAAFTARFLAPRPADTSVFTLYRRLLASSPAPFSACLVGDGHGLAGASPERFLKLDAEGRIETRPIKGTRPRGPTPQTDRALAQDLADSVKDRAENLMITDLLRNDLGRVARVGSVKVPALCRLESFASVHHLVSVIEARLRPGLGPIDLLRATFPGGSVTGAPKIRAMEIIDELEAARRGPYCGAVVWIGGDGAMDSAITIRTLTLTRDQVVAQAGGGIVADSDPEGEYEEMIIKIRPLLATLGAA